jgi:hypothetical protein
VQADREARVGSEVDVQAVLGRAGRGSDLRAELLPLRGCELEVRLTQEPAWLAGERDTGPVAIRRSADTDERDDHPSRARIGDAPVVALHLDAVCAARIAERRVRAGPAVGGQEAIQRRQGGLQTITR